MAKSSNGYIRIISGKWRGRKLPVLDKDGLRPTTDRIKETLFNWLMSDINETICLDCFTGSGSLGFEALSRGARKVVLLEKDLTISQQLEKNSQILQSHAITVHHTDTLQWLNNLANEQFNLVFIDPPFRQDLTIKTIELLEKNAWLQPQAIIYIETESEYPLLNFIPKNWQLHREKKTGQVYSRLFIRESD